MRTQDGEGANEQEGRARRTSCARRRCQSKLAPANKPIAGMATFSRRSWKLRALHPIFCLCHKPPTPITRGKPFFYEKAADKPGITEDPPSWSTYISTIFWEILPPGLPVSTLFLNYSQGGTPLEPPLWSALFYLPVCLVGRLLAC